MPESEWFGYLRPQYLGTWTTRNAKLETLNLNPGKPRQAVNSGVFLLSPGPRRQFRNAGPTPKGSGNVA